MRKDAKSNWNLIFGLLIAVAFLMGLSFADRLPIANTDNDTWGSTLNSFLLVTFDQNGSIRDNNVTGNMIANQTIVARNIATGAVNSTGILDFTIGAADIAVGNTVNNSHIAPNSVNSSIITDFTIGAADIALGNTVNNSHIATSSVNASQILLGANITLGNPTGVSQPMNNSIGIGLQLFMIQLNRTGGTGLPGLVVSVPPMPFCSLSMEGAITYNVTGRVLCLCNGTNWALIGMSNFTTYTNLC